MKLTTFLLFINTCLAYNDFYYIQYSELVQNLSLEASNERRAAEFRRYKVEQDTKEFLNEVSEVLFKSRRLDFLPCIKFYGNKDIDMGLVKHHLLKAHGFPINTKLDFHTCEIGESDPLCMSIIVNGKMVTNSP